MLKKPTKELQEKYKMIKNKANSIQKIRRKEELKKKIRQINTET